HLSFEGLDLPASQPDADLVAVDEALAVLGAEDPRKARVGELRFFGGLTVEETAEALGVSTRTVHTDWAFARAWLYRALTKAHVHCTLSSSRRIVCRSAGAARRHPGGFSRPNVRRRRVAAGRGSVAGHCVG